MTSVELISQLENAKSINQIAVNTLFAAMKSENGELKDGDTIKEIVRNTNSGKIYLQVVDQYVAHVENLKQFRVYVESSFMEEYHEFDTFREAKEFFLSY